MAEEINATVMINLRRSAKQNLVDLINRANNTQFKEEDFIVEAPSSPTEDDPVYTEVVVKGRIERGMGGEVVVGYNRIDLNGLRDLAEEFFPVEPDDTVETVRQKAQDFLYTLPGEIRIIGDFDPTQNTLTVAGKSDSLVYIGQTELTLARLVQYLIANTEPNGFNYTETGDFQLSEVIESDLSGLVHLPIIDRRVGAKANGFDREINLNDLIVQDLNPIEPSGNVGRFVDSKASGFDSRVGLDGIIVQDLNPIEPSGNVGRFVDSKANGFGYHLPLNEVITSDLNTFS